MGGVGSGRRPGGGGSSKNKKLKIKLGKNKKIGYKIDSIGSGGRVYKSTGWKY